MKRFPLSRLACLYYHIRFSLSRTFFKFFKLFSEDFVFCVARSNFAMLAHPTPFVKNFFQVFSNFIIGCFISTVPCGQLAYISTLRCICQEFFSSFLLSISTSLGCKFLLRCGIFFNLLLIMLLQYRYGCPILFRLPK